MKFLEKLHTRKASGEFRQFTDNQGFIDFWSNDYLGLSQLRDQSSLKSGSTGSRLISGHYDLSYEVETKYANFFGSEKALLFNSGYDANLGLFSSVPQRGEVILYDELCHASIRDGIRLGMANAFSFRHNDVNDLLSKLEKHAGQTIFVVVESVYSMDGDLAPLKQIVAACQSFNAQLIVDEAHSVGVFGTNGEGLVHELDLSDQVFARVITFGKAFGLHGAMVLGSDDLYHFLLNFARSLIFTTAPAPSHLEALNSRLDKVIKANSQREQLRVNIAQLNEMLQLDNRSPVFSIRFDDLETCQKVADELNKKQIAAKVIYSPTVPKGEERIRICLHCFNSEKELILLAEILKKQ